MPGTGDALRRTSDSLLRDLEALLELEEEKRTIDPGDPRLVDLASQIEQIAKRVLASSTSQRAQTQLIHALTEADSPAAPDATIEDTPRSMEAILAAWRQAERQLDAAEPGSAEADGGADPRRSAARGVPAGARRGEPGPLTVAGSQRARLVASPAGFEPATFRLEGGCSVH